MMLLNRMIGRFEKNLFLLLLIYLIGLCLLTPPFQVADENAHFYRAVQVSQLEGFPTRSENTVGGEIPVSLVESANVLQSGIPFNPQNKFSLSVLRSEFSRIFNEADKNFIGFPNTALYSPVPYVFSGGALWIAKKLSLPPPAHLYVSRMTNTIMAVFLIYSGSIIFSSLTIPLLLLAFIPMFSFQLASASADSAMFALAVLYSCSLARAFVESKSEPKEALTYFIAAIFSFALLVLCKQAYLPLGLPLLILMGSAVKNKKFFLLKMFVAVTAAVPVLIWNYRIQSLFAPTRLDVVIDPSLQLKFILNSPRLFVDLLVQTLSNSYGVLWQQMIGVLGWLDTWLNPKINDLLGLLLFCSIFMVPRQLSRIGVSSSLLILKGIILSALLIIVLIYMSWNPPGYLSSIEGLQGRYFLPLVPFAFLLIIFQPRLSFPKPLQFGTKFSRLYVICFVFLSQWITISSLLRRYYL